jgi:hypothetical protein
MSTKSTTGLNDRPKDETIAQSGGGLPDDSGEPIEVSDEKVERVRSKLVGGKSKTNDSEARRDPR